jgi:hypothetical protein
MTLEEALRQLAADLELDAEELIAYAEEDDETGWDFNEGDWPIGSVFRAEGQTLYALVRALRPSVVVEYGTQHGCSAKHILMALARNRKGKLISVDNAFMANHQRFTEAQNRRWEWVYDDADGADVGEEADIVFEDCGHSIEGTRQIMEHALALNPRLILSHDAEHPTVGPTVREGFLQALGSINTVLIEPSDCGLGYWVNPERNDAA